MSTFKGFVAEFPEIRIDYFRKLDGRDNPLACFLSHVHSDHLQGLESYLGPFIYCSPTTRELLLRLEKYPHRMNLHRGILESRKQHHKHLKNLLTIALNTPTKVELSPGRSLRVTLLDANHCAGAVMFLIENDTKAILYTGDIRSEPWWVNSLIRNPVVLPYTHGLKRLDKIYLDTTFASQEDHCRKFPAKADGLEELLQKVLKYPVDTVFHFNAWTFGYEEVWIALSNTLRSQVHVDAYKYSLYKTLTTLTTTDGSQNPCYEGSALCGFQCGNIFQDGCLTTESNVRLHSCQHDMGCSALEASNIVYIRPIISRSAEGVLPEVGAGGGGGDFNQVYELALDDTTKLEDLIESCKKEIENQEIRSKTIKLIIKAKKTQKTAVLLGDLGLLNMNHQTIPLAELPNFLAKLVVGDGEVGQIDERVETSSRSAVTGRAKTLETSLVRQELPRSIEFPYSRHSSYEELCHLVKAFEPVDVYPCTIDEEYKNLNISIADLFGHLCFGSTFAHDEEMRLLARQQEIITIRANDRDSQTMQSLREESVDQQNTSPISLLESTSDAESRVVDNLERMPKRLRASPVSLGNQGRFDTASLSTGVMSPERKSRLSKRTFENLFKRRKTENMLPVPTSTNPTSNRVGDNSGVSRTAMFDPQESSAALDSENTPSTKTLGTGLMANSPEDVYRGTQAQPIELSDGDPSSQGNEAGGFLLEDMPEPDDTQDAFEESQPDPETQVTLSDTAFESQSSHMSNPGIKKTRLQQRKEAYKAAKEPSGIWETDYGLISSNAHHGEEEIEL